MIPAKIEIDNTYAIPVLLYTIFLVFLFFSNKKSPSYIRTSYYTLAK